MTTVVRTDRGAVDVTCPAGCDEFHDLDEVQREGMIRHIVPLRTLTFPREGIPSGPAEVMFTLCHWVYGDRPTEIDVSLHGDALPEFFNIAGCAQLAVVFGEASHRLERDSLAARGVVPKR